MASPGIGSGGVGRLMTPAWEYRHERTRRHVGLTAPQSESSQGRKSRRDRLRAGAVVEVIQDGPSMAGRLAWLSARLMIRPTLSVGSCLPSAPWPWGVVEFAARAITPTPGTVRAGVALAHCTAQLVRAAGVLPADGHPPGRAVSARRGIPHLRPLLARPTGEHAVQFRRQPSTGAQLPQDSQTFDPRGDRRLLPRLPGGCAEKAISPTRSCWPAIPPAATWR